MATIHVLKTTTSEREMPSPLVIRQSAEIILFPGVRYERWIAPRKADVSAEKQKRKRRSRVKRDRMTISV